LLFFYIGILCENSRRNWFIGIRTPWTLSSDRVWEKTHRLGGKLFKAAGVIAMLGALIQEHAFILILAPIIFAAAYTIIYSYVEYQKEVKCGK
ncbi:MAG: SdpI family protein, partial [Candidatus Bathyarchaeia archaeon]